MKIVILGAGPTGLGAAYRLRELGYPDWEIYEKNPYVGGLAASFRDGKGYTWDIGGHVLFSHCDYVDKLVDKLLGDDYSLHDRDAWVRVMNLWVPYPFQDHIRYLPKDMVLECVLGLIEATDRKETPRNFQEWILYTFGKGIARYFMLPYNRKLWAYPLDLIDSGWIAERVSVVDIAGVLRRLIYQEDDRGWGPNRRFKFPLRGGTGGLFNRFLPYIRDHLVLGEEMVEVDIERKVAKFAHGREVTYDILINTTPLDQFVFKMSPRIDFLVDAASELKHNGVFSVGIGFRKPCPSQKSWVYFSDEDCCFYRVTYFSNYSPYNVPDASRHYSLMCETSFSNHKPGDRNKIVDKTIGSLIATGLISQPDVELIDTAYVVQAEHAYPIPTLGRDNALKVIQPYLEARGIYSRGRFGAWRYELGNMDHSIMAGTSTVNHILGVRE